jgi:hypothetical protein
MLAKARASQAKQAQRRAEARKAARRQHPGEAMDVDDADEPAEEVGCRGGITGPSPAEHTPAAHCSTLHAVWPSSRRGGLLPALGAAAPALAHAPLPLPSQEELEDISDRSMLQLFGHTAPVHALDFTPDAQLLLSASSDATVRAWSPELRRGLAVYRGHAFPVWAVAACGHGGYFASGGADRTARIWSIEINARPLRLLAGARRLGRAPARALLAAGDSCGGRGDGASAALTLHLMPRPACFAKMPPRLQATSQTSTPSRGTPTASTWPPAAQTAACACGTCAAAAPRA